MYHSIVIRESLKNKSVLDKYRILRTKISERWHMHIIEVLDPEEFIATIQSTMTTSQPYYFHIYNNNNLLIVAFKDKMFKLNSNDKNTWVEAQKYGGEQLGIPGEELDFIPNNFADEEDWYDKK